jgi:hypothetical protein
LTESFAFLTRLKLSSGLVLSRLSTPGDQHTQKEGRSQRMQWRIERRIAEHLANAHSSAGQRRFVTGENTECLIGGLLHSRLFWWA